MQNEKNNVLTPGSRLDAGWPAAMVHAGTQAFAGLHPGPPCSIRPAS